MIPHDVLVILRIAVDALRHVAHGRRHRVSQDDAASRRDTIHSFIQFRNAPGRLPERAHVIARARTCIIHLGCRPLIPRADAWRRKVRIAFPACPKARPPHVNRGRPTEHRRRGKEFDPTDNWWQDFRRIVDWNVFDCGRRTPADHREGSGVDDSGTCRQLPHHTTRVTLKSSTNVTLHNRTAKIKRSSPPINAHSSERRDTPQGSGYSRRPSSIVTR
jgi:hypothetical protein